MRTSLTEKDRPIDGLSRTTSFTENNARTSELSSDHADITRRLSDKSRASTSSRGASILSLLAARRNSSALKRG